jgi:hypothetical protein
MAAPKSMNGTKLLIMLGDGGGTEVFTHPCLINADRGIAFSGSSSDQVIPDCTTPDEPGWVIRTVDGLTASITGAGVVDTASLATFWTWFNSAIEKNIRVKVDVPLADSGGHWAMKAVLTDFSVSGTRNEKASFDCTILSSGAVTWVPASA